MTWRVFYLDRGLRAGHVIVDYWRHLLCCDCCVHATVCVLLLPAAAQSFLASHQADAPRRRSVTNRRSLHFTSLAEVAITAVISAQRGIVFRHECGSPRAAAALGAAG